MSDKKRLMIDLDDVICDGGFLYLINTFLNTNYVVEDFTQFYMQDIIPNERKEEWFTFFSNSNIYDHVNFIENARETLEKLNEKYELFIVTAYIIKDRTSISSRILKDKFEWLEKNLPFMSSYNYVFTSNKAIIDCDIKIDDRLSNLTGNIHTKTKLLFNAYHNEKLTDEQLNEFEVTRVSGWNEIEKLLL